MKVANIKFLIFSLGLLGLNFLFPISTEATTLGDLPLGSVIQIDASEGNGGMCGDAKCSYETDFVLPYKFVKMQARRTTAGSPATDIPVGENGNCPEDDTDGCAGYSYFMLMDNYCWWGSAECRIGVNIVENGVEFEAGDITSIYQSFNGSCENWDGTVCQSDTTGTGYSNNLSDPKGNNILQPMANLYNSLPTEIGGQSKTTAVASYNWDMIGIANNATGTPAVGWYTGTAGNDRNWPATSTDGSYTTNGITYIFSGDTTAPVMTSKIGLLSYTEWQGGLFGFSMYPVIEGGNSQFNPPNTIDPEIAALGSGSVFCKARFNAYNCNLNDNGTFGYPRPFSSINSFTYLDDSGEDVFIAFSSSINPRVRFPWFRSTFATNATTARYVSSSSETYSVTSSPTFRTYGVSPTLWLSSDIEILENNSDSVGTYDNPYCLLADDNCSNHSENIEVVVELESGIGLDCDDTIDLGVIYLYGVNRENFNCSVLSNNPTGYEINFQSASALVNTDSSLTDEIIPLATPGQLSSATAANWAVNASSTANPTDSNWRTTGTLIQTSAPSLATGDPYTFQAGVSIGQQVILNPGTYVGSFILTATSI